MANSAMAQNTIKPVREKTNWRLGAFYSLGEVGSQLSWYMINSYLTIFYTDIVGLSASAISLIMLIARVWDAINDPMMGAIADRTHSRWGKFRPYLMFAPPFLAVFNLLTFTVFPLHGVTKVIVCMLCYIGAGMAYTAVCITYGGLVNLIARDSQVRMNYTSCRAIGSGAIQMILSAVAMPLILYFSHSKTPNARGYFMMALCCSIALIPCFELCAWKCKETVHVDAPTNKKKMPAGKALLMLLKNKYLVVVVISVFAGAMGSMARMSMLSYYVIYVVGSPVMIAPIFTTMTVCQLIGNFTLPMGTKLMGKKGFYLLTSYIGVAGLVAMYFIPATNIAGILVISAIIGLTMANGNISTGMLSDCIEYGDWKYGIREEGLTYSMMSFGVKMATAVTGTVTVLMLSAIGYVPNVEQTASVKMGIDAIVNLFPAAVMLFATLIIHIVYKLPQSRMDQIYADLDARRDKEKEAAIPDSNQ